MDKCFSHFREPVPSLHPSPQFVLTVTFISGNQICSIPILMLTFGSRIISRTPKVDIPYYVGFKNRKSFPVSVFFKYLPFARTLSKNIRYSRWAAASTARLTISQSSRYWATQHHIQLIFIGANFKVSVFLKTGP